MLARRWKLTTIGHVVEQSLNLHHSREAARELLKNYGMYTERGEVALGATWDYFDKQGRWPVASEELLTVAMVEHAKTARVFEDQKAFELFYEILDWAIATYDVNIPLATKAYASTFQRFSPAYNSIVDRALEGIGDAIEVKMDHSENISRSEQIEILLQYDDHVSTMVHGMRGLPRIVIENVLERLLQDPETSGQALKEMRNKVILEALGRPDLEWGVEFEALVEICNSSDIEDVEELFRVFPILSKRMRPAEVVNKIFRQKWPKKYWVYGVRGVAGPKFELVKHSPNYYILMVHTGEKDFTSLDDVFDYLQTPVANRQLVEQK